VQTPSVTTPSCPPQALAIAVETSFTQFSFARRNAEALPYNRLFDVSDIVRLLEASESKKSGVAEGVDLQRKPSALDAAPAIPDFQQILNTRRERERLR
jgi:hypothetical protein